MAHPSRIRRKKRVRTALYISFLSIPISCATIAKEGQGDVDLPVAYAGPFRSLKRGQVCDGDVCNGVDELPPGTSDGLAKAPGSPRSRSPTALVRGTGLSDDYDVVLYVARDLAADPARIARMEAKDARTFDDVVDVIDASEPFEGTSVGDPWAIEVSGEVWLYYAVHPQPGKSSVIAGIARARSSDGRAGRSFVKDAAPLLDEAGPKGAWETEAPRAPSVVRDDAGTFHLFYASGVAIGEATSTDGVHFARVDGDPSTPSIDPVVKPSEPVDLATLPTGVKPPFDDLAVDDPSVLRSISPLGRVVYHLHYTGRDRRGGSAIGLAGRFGENGSFERAVGAVFGGRQNPHVNAPAVARFPSFALLYCNVDHDTAQAIGVAVSPAAVKLPIKE